MCLAPLLMAFKDNGGNSAVQDLAPKKRYRVCFASNVGPDLFCRANFQKQ